MHKPIPPSEFDLYFVFVFFFRQQQQSPMFGGSDTFNNLLSGNSFNRIFADTPTPSDPVIDLSSGCETEEFDSHSQASSRKRHHGSEVLNVAKRKAHDSIISESQKNRNRNMPLKKRGTGNREEELSFLNLLANENSNQAQNLVKIECATDSSTCDSSSSVHPKRFLNLEPKNEVVCDCFNCFPVLGSKGAPKCKKLRKPTMDSAGSSSSSSSSEAIDASMIPGPSGIQQKKTIKAPAKKRNYFSESDSDDSDDQIQIPEQAPPPILIEDEPADTKNCVLAAPDLQLDWLTDSSPEEDDDVIFVSDRSAPIDLTADSDTDAPSPNDAASIARGPTEVANEFSISSVRNSPVIQPAIAPSRYVEPFYCLQIPPQSNMQRVHPTTVNTQRTPIMSSVASTTVPPQISLSTPPRVIINIPTPPLHTPAPRQTNFRDMITGSDVMLYAGQNYVPRFMRETPSNPPAETCDPAPAPLIRQRAQNQSPVHDHHQRRSYNLPSVANYYRPPSPVLRHQNVPPSSATDNPVVPPTAHQNCRQHVGRCPFMTEGHHYNRPRRFSRDFYSVSNQRPYAVHEDLWRRQYQEQEIRRRYWSPSFNENAPEVQVLRPPPATSYMAGESATPHIRLVPALSDNNNNHSGSNVTNPTDSLRSFDRRQQPNAHTRYRRAVPW